MLPARLLRDAWLAATAAASVAVAAPVLAAPDDGFVVHDPHFGEVLFHFYQGDHFTALTHLVTARSQERVGRHAFDAELLQGGLLLSWGQHVEAGRIFERLLETTEDPALRDRTWFYLGKVRYQRGYIDGAEQALAAVTGSLPAELEAERSHLLARIYMSQQRFADAVALLDAQQGEADWQAYARFNTGVALVRMGELELGARVLEALGTMRATSEEMRSLRDRANLALGFAYLQSDLDGDALPLLQRVRLDGPFSNKALLGAGWASLAREEYRGALAAWLTLSDRDLLDSAVQESLLAVPYAYAQLGSERIAAERYAHALDVFGAEIRRLDEALVAADTGTLIDDLLARDPGGMGGWYWELDQLPGDARARYLYFTIANHDFHEALKSYRDLSALEKHLLDWQEKLGAFDDILATRERAFAERLPAVTQSVGRYDIEAAAARTAALESETTQAVAERDVVAFASDKELQQWRTLEALETNPAWNTPQAESLRAKQRLLKGRLLWTLDEEFRLRAWRQTRALETLRESVAEARDKAAAVEAATASVPAEIARFGARVDRLGPRVSELLRQVSASRQAHADFLNRIASGELDRQKERLLTYRAQARFALANIYDRMAAVQP